MGVLVHGGGEFVLIGVKNLVAGGAWVYFCGMILLISYFEHYGNKSTTQTD
jgi:hypothetical protein